MHSPPAKCEYKLSVASNNLVTDSPNGDLKLLDQGYDFLYFVGISALCDCV